MRRQSGWESEQSRLEKELKTTRQTIESEHFYSLVVRNTRRRRSCLKCRETFMSSSSGNRICSTCTASNAKQIIKQEYNIESDQA